MNVVSSYINRIGNGNERLKRDLFKARRSNSGIATKSDTTITNSGKAYQKWVIADAIKYHDYLIKKYELEREQKLDDELHSKSIQLTRQPYLKVSRKNGLKYSDTFKVKHL